MQNQCIDHDRRVRTPWTLQQPFTLVAGFAIVLALACHADGAVKTWTGQAGGNWSVAANWSPSGAPVAGDSLIFGPVNAGRTKSTTNSFATTRTFARLTFVDSGYAVRGNPVSLSGGIDATQSTGGITIYSDVLLAANQAFRVYLINASLTVAGSISGDVPTGDSGLVVSNGFRTTSTLSGRLTELRSLTKRGTGVLVIAGNNDYLGSTTISDGLVRVENTSALGSASGDTTINTGATLLVEVDSSPSVAFAEPLTLEGGTLSVLNETVNWNGTIETLGGTFNCATNTRLWVNAAVSGAGGLTKAEPGALYLMAANSYAGTTLVNEGSLHVGNATALGTAAQGSTVSGTAMLVLGGYADLPRSLDIATEALRFTGTKCTLAYYGHMSWGGPITVDANATGIMRGGRHSDYPYQYSSLHLPGTLGGTGTLEFKADEFDFYVTLGGAGANVHTGNTRVLSGVLNLDKPDDVTAIAGPLEVRGYISPSNVGGRVAVLSRDQLGGPSISMYNGGQLLLNGHRTETQQLFMQGGSIHPGPGGELVLWTGHPAVVASGGIIDYYSEGVLWLGVLGDGEVEVLGNSRLALGSRIMNDGEIYDKIGSGKLELIGDINRATTRLKQGTLEVNGNQPSSRILMTNQTVLQGSGAVGPVTAWSGTVRPGLSPGRFTVGQNLTLISNVTFEVELNGPTAGTNYDQLQVNGTVSLGSSALKTSLGFVPATGASFVLINNDGIDAVSGTFAGLPEGSTVLAYGLPLSFRISYRAGDGNDVTLTRLPAPGARFTSSSIVGQQVRLEATGLPGLPYYLDAAATLSPPVLWNRIGTNTANASGLIQFIDSDVSLHPQRFYRIISP